ncbi:DUF4355 domain-containing protein [Paenibacillus albicereus]|uniref:DUF4355 domain-containing protein n=2 Tax=Paenibacillus albicereus TaxID=2726185 RepID=A0A6H2H429_9BACL|nr:DUF4355 domain-containing protein [Paenibacillus albicereus]
MKPAAPEFAKKVRYPLNLQLFAEGEGGAEAAGGGEGDKGGDGGAAAGGKAGEGEKKSFTQEDLDRILTERLGKAQSKWEKDLQTKLDEAKTEAEKLAKMTADQKAEHERQKREKALADREGEITRRELRATALEQLAEKGLPKSLADILSYTDAESTNKGLEAVEKAFREAVEAGVNERLKSSGTGTPKGGSGGSAVPGAEEIAKIFAKR